MILFRASDGISFVGITAMFPQHPASITKIPRTLSYFASAQIIPRFFTIPKQEMWL